MHHLRINYEFIKVLLICFLLFGFGIPKRHPYVILLLDYDASQSNVLHFLARRSWFYHDSFPWILGAIYSHKICSIVWPDGSNSTSSCHEPCKCEDRRIVTSICMAQQVKHVNNAPYLFNCDLFFGWGKDQTYLLHSWQKEELMCIFQLVDQPFFENLFFLEACYM